MEKIFYINNIWVYFVSFILSVMILFSTQYIKQFFKYKEENKRRVYFLNFLSTNEKINECLNQFKKIINLKWHHIVIISLIGFILGVLLTLVIYAILFYYIDDWWLATACLTLINFIPYLLIICSIESTKKNPLERAYSFIMIRHFTFVLSYFTNSVIILLIYLSYFSSSKIESNLLIIVGILSISTTFLIGVIYELIYGEKEIIYYLKSALNKKFLNNFPEICVFVENNKFCGIIENIFENNLIVLHDKGQQIAIEWDKIILISLKKSKITQTQLNC